MFEAPNSPCVRVESLQKKDSTLIPLHGGRTVWCYPVQGSYKYASKKASTNHLTMDVHLQNYVMKKLLTLGSLMKSWLFPLMCEHIKTQTSKFKKIVCVCGCVRLCVFCLSPLFPCWIVSIYSCPNWTPQTSPKTNLITISTIPPRLNSLYNKIRLKALSLRSSTVCKFSFTNLRYRCTREKYTY